MSKINFQPTELGLISWFNRLDYRAKLFIFRSFQDVDDKTV